MMKPYDVDAKDEAKAMLGLALVAVLLIYGVVNWLR